MTLLCSCHEAPHPQTILMVHGLAGRGGCSLVASQHGRLEVGMAAGVLDQVVTAHEALIAQWAQEAFLPCVGTGVAGELIRAGKLLFTVGPGAREGPLTCSTEAEREGGTIKHHIKYYSNINCLTSSLTITTNLSCINPVHQLNRNHYVQLSSLLISSTSGI